jgi:hypothetical protein
VAVLDEAGQEDRKRRAPPGSTLLVTVEAGLAWRFRLAGMGSMIVGRSGFPRPSGRGMVHADVDAAQLLAGAGAGAGGGGGGGGGASDVRTQRALAVTVRDRLGELFPDEQFAGAFGVRGRPGWSPGRLALITVLQMAENL